MSCNRGEEETKEFYYNVEKTTNPYVVTYIPAQIETLSDNFKILDKDIRVYSYNNDGRIVIGGLGRNGGLAIVDKEVLDTVLTSYKEQLLENKKKVIIDVHLLNYNAADGFSYTMRNILKDYGLSLGKDGKVGIKKISKPKPARTTLNKRETFHFLRQSLISYLQVKLGIGIKIYGNSNRDYKLIDIFKTLCPNVSYNDVIVAINEYYRHEECEKIWNNPELAKTKPKEANKKVKK